MSDQAASKPAGWIQGLTCPVCETAYCRPHSPLQIPGPKDPPLLGTTGLEQTDVGRITVVVLDQHMAFGSRSRVGQAVRDSKTYGRTPGNPAVAKVLAEASAQWIEKFFWRRVLDGEITAIVPVPHKPHRPGFSLPAVLAAAFGLVLDVPVLQPLRWDKFDLDAKTAVGARVTSGLAERLEILQNLQGEHVLVVDDVLKTGNTIRAVDRRLREAEAECRFGFAVTRAGSGGLGRTR